ncbi:unannotated protein [freshwater metagenome]|uniref:Unannotated protein n=1 Tax=freshwater metagenome TaxID=449393 RepID=A0A6J7UXL0_9ZZZZ
MGHADVLASHHQVVDSCRVKATERHLERLPITCVPCPIPQAEVVTVVDRVVQTERTRIANHSIIEMAVLPDIGLREDVIADVPVELPLAGYVAHPVELQICPRVGFERSHVRERSVDRAQQVITNVFTVEVGVKPLPVLPEVGKGLEHAPTNVRVWCSRRSGNRSLNVVDTRSFELPTEIRKVLRHLRRPGNVREVHGVIGLASAKENGVTVMLLEMFIGGEALAKLRPGLDAEHGGGTREQTEDRRTGAVDEQWRRKTALDSCARLAGID